MVTTKHQHRLFHYHQQSDPRKQTPLTCSCRQMPYWRTPPITAAPVQPTVPSLVLFLLVTLGSVVCVTSLNRANATSFFTTQIPAINGPTPTDPLLKSSIYPTLPRPAHYSASDPLDTHQSGKPLSIHLFQISTHKEPIP